MLARCRAAHACGPTDAVEARMRCPAWAPLAAGEGWAPGVRKLEAVHDTGGWRRRRVAAGEPQPKPWRVPFL